MCAPHPLAQCCAVLCCQLNSCVFSSLVRLIAGFGTIVGSKMIEKDGKRQVLVQFDTPEAALDTLVSKHGSELGSATIRLAFSKTVSL